MGEIYQRSLCFGHASARVKKNKVQSVDVHPGELGMRSNDWY